MDLVNVGIDATIFLLKLTLLTYVGLFLAYIACRREKLLRIGFIFKPLARVSKLPMCCSFYFLMTLINLTSSTPTLLGFHKQGLVSDDEQVIAATITAGLPIMFWYVLFFTGPIAIGVFGIKNGLLFLAVWVAIGLVETIMGVIYGRIRITEVPQGGCGVGDGDGISNENEKESENERVDFKQEIKDAIKDSFRTLLQILKVLAPVIFLLYIIISSENIMAHVNEVLRPIAGVLPLESEAVPIALMAAFNLIVAISMAQQLIVNGLPVIDAFMAIVAGMFLYNLFEVFHTLIPYNVSFFGKKLGLKVAVALFLAIGISDLAVIMMLWCVKVFVLFSI